MAKQKVSALVDGGKATPGPPLGPVLGPLGVNVVKVVQAINEKTKDFAGMKVPIELVVDTDSKAFDVTVGTPPTTALLFKELGVEKGSGKPNTEKAGDIPFEGVVKVARMKQASLLGKDLKRKVKEVLGTCVSAGITVEGKDPREVQKAVDAGEFDAKISG